MKTFFCYYGGKWRIADKYPPPMHNVIVEPFAGSAGYATRRSNGRKVLLIDRNEIIVDLWRWLQIVKPSEILALLTCASSA